MDKVVPTLPFRPELGSLSTTAGAQTIQATKVADRKDIVYLVNKVEHKFSSKPLIWSYSFLSNILTWIFQNKGASLIGQMNKNVSVCLTEVHIFSKHFLLLCILLVEVFTYCRYKCTDAKVIILQISHSTDS